jgi:hypothetical protein
MYWLLVYDLVDDYLERREPLRPEHLALAQEAHQHGDLALALAPSPTPSTWLCSCGRSRTRR